MSRTMSNDHLSPKISSEMLTGQPDRRLRFDFRGTNRKLPSLAFCKQAKIAFLLNCFVGVPGSGVLCFQFFRWLEFFDRNMEPRVCSGNAGVDGELQQHFLDIARLEFMREAGAQVHSKFVP